MRFPAHSVLLDNDKRTWLAVLEGGLNSMLGSSLELEPHLFIYLFFLLFFLRTVCDGEMKEKAGFWKNCCWNSAMTAAYM